MNPELVITAITVAVFVALALVLPMVLRKVTVPGVTDVNASLESSGRNMRTVVAGAVVVAVSVALALYISKKTELVALVGKSQ